MPALATCGGVSEKLSHLFDLYPVFSLEPVPLPVNAEEFFERLKPKVEKRLTFTDDKSEETVESTIKALWFAAIGLAVSSEQAVRLPLPELNSEQARIFYRLLSQRFNNKPLAHITGRQSFMGLELMSDYRALIPRKETEILGRKALELSYQLSQQKHGVKVVDLCCGAGNLGLAIAYFNSNVFVTASDLSPESIELTRENIAFLNLGNRVATKVGDMFEPFESEEYYGNIDLIVCNPPYISSAKVPRMHEQISAYEPLQAFDGGSLGFTMIRKLITEAPRFLARPGWLVFEVGAGQGPFVLQTSFKSGKFHHVEVVNDRSGVIRVILARNQ